MYAGHEVYSDSYRDVRCVGVATCAKPPRFALAQSRRGRHGPPPRIRPWFSTNGGEACGYHCRQRVWYHWGKARGDHCREGICSGGGLCGLLHCRGGDGGWGLVPVKRIYQTARWANRLISMVLTCLTHLRKLHWTFTYILCNQTAFTRSL